MIGYKRAKNSNQVKVAFLHMLSQVPGQHWLRQGLQAKPQKAPALCKPDGDSKWNPDEEDLRVGIQHINQYAPLSNSKNEQYLWVLLNVRRDPESPLHGWPEHVVLKACANRTTGNSQAEPEWFFPLLNDLNEEFLEKVVPLVIPRMTSFGLMILGKAGIGKTPAAQIMSMAVARHLVHSRGLDGLPGYRKSKQIDGFRERPGEVQVPVLLDDPNLGAINLEDLKSFLDVGENCLVRNQSPHKRTSGCLPPSHHVERVQGHVPHCSPIPQNTPFDGNLEKNHCHHCWTSCSICATAK